MFSLLSVRDNLMLGAYCRRDREAVKQDFEKVLGWFPDLRSFIDKQAAYLSGRATTDVGAGPGLHAETASDAAR